MMGQWKAFQILARLCPRDSRAPTLKSIMIYPGSCFKFCYHVAKIALDLLISLQIKENGVGQGFQIHMPVWAK
jgi:hypothetical protein